VITLTSFSNHFIHIGKIKKDSERFCSKFEQYVRMVTFGMLLKTTHLSSFQSARDLTIIKFSRILKKFTAKPHKNTSTVCYNLFFS